MKFFAYFVSFITLFLSFVGANSVGGWHKLPADDQGARAAAAFAVRESTQRENVKFVVVSAQGQVVAGMKYALEVEVSAVANHCKLVAFEVWDRFGTMRLQKEEDLGACAN